jgi:hypothetical protein
MITDNLLSDSEDHPDFQHSFVENETSTQQNRPSVIVYAPSRGQNTVDLEGESSNSNSTRGTNENVNLEAKILVEAFEKSIVRHYRVSNINEFDLENF